MVELSISIESEFGLTWSRWQRLVPAIESLGFAAIYLADHFVLTEPPDPPALELIVALTWLADHTERVRFGPRVAPLSVRDPVMLARQAAALSDLSGGRMELGLGTGWMEREHEMFGYALGDQEFRYARLEEGLEVITRLLRSEAPVSFEGRFFRLREAMLPGPKRVGEPALTIGGSGPRRTLPLVARFADTWNAQMVTPEQFHARSHLLDQMLAQVGRQPGDVRRTFNTFVVCGRTPAEQADRLHGFRLFQGFVDMPADQVMDELRTGLLALVGTPDEIIEQIRAYEAAGATEVSLQWTALDDLEGLELVASDVLTPLSA